MKYALKKCNNDFQSTLNHLLNMQYLEETGQQTRGIDGFAQLEEPRKQRKGKGKGRKREASEDTKNSVPEELIQEVKGMLAGCYISKVSMLTYVPPQSKPKLVTLQNASISLSMPSQRHTTTVTAHHQPLWWLFSTSDSRRTPALFTTTRPKKPSHSCPANTSEFLKSTSGPSSTRPAPLNPFRMISPDLLTKSLLALRGARVRR